MVIYGNVNFLYVEIFGTKYDPRNNTRHYIKGANSMSNDQKEQLILQKSECERAILNLMCSETGDYLFVRGVLEKLIFKIEDRLEIES